jgi:glycosyltransferase involved in cell wall biosynthesis
MKKLILTQIMKNESHVAKRMLDSIKSIVDGICVIDTGSTDDSIEVVRKWGSDNGIETYVFERPFDNFENSRNYSFQKARELFLKDDVNTYYNFWLDFDEQMIISPNFNKNSLDKDLYMLNTNIGRMKYTRNEVCRLDKKFKFYGPIHEYIISEESNITSGLLSGLEVLVSMDGGSWKEDISKKYKNHAHVLESYIDDNRKDPRWIFYTAQSYHDSASLKDNNEDNRDRLLRSIRYYRERVSRPDGYHEEIFYSQFRIGSIMRRLEEPWSLTMAELLKAYNMDPLRGEPIKVICEHYINIGEYHNAYIWSSFGVKNFHGKNPYPNRLLFVDSQTYDWKFLELHAATCYYTGRKDESRETYKHLISLTSLKRNLFSDEDISKIESNKTFFL